MVPGTRRGQQAAGRQQSTGHGNRHRACQESTGHVNREPREPAPSAPRHGPRGRCRPRPHCTVILSAAEHKGRTASRAAQRRVQCPIAHPPPVLTHGRPEGKARPGAGRRDLAAGQEPGAAATPEPSPPRRKWPPHLRTAACRPGAEPAPFSVAARRGWRARPAASRVRARAPPKRPRPPCEGGSWSHLPSGVRADNGHTPDVRAEQGPVLP